MPWFHGHPDTSQKLLPSIMRAGNQRHEFELTKRFRLMAPGYGLTPETSRLDRWLFLMQHYRSPTGLLDWTESPLIVAFFAMQKAAQDHKIERDSAVFALDPAALNKESGIADFPVTWVENSVKQTIKFAFGTQEEKVDGKKMPYLELPVAIFPDTVHPRIASQKACFTLHGSDNHDIEEIFAERRVISDRRITKYRIPKDKVAGMFQELWDLGIPYTTLFPDLDGLAKEVNYRFEIKG